MIDISQWVGRKDDREFVLKPFRANGFVYATNGHVAIRIPDDASIEAPIAEGKAAEIAVKMDRWMSEQTYGEGLPIPPLPEPIDCLDCVDKGYRMLSACKDCAGQGYFEHGRHDYNCQECNGEGHVDDYDGVKTVCGRCGGYGEERATIVLGDSAYDVIYLRLASKLPNPRLFTKGPTEHGLCKFDGGTALIMPRRP